MLSQSTSFGFFTSLLFTSSLLVPAAHALPSSNARSHCRCVSVSSRAPQSTLFLEASRSRHWHCAELGPKLEYWRKTNPDDFQGAWEELFGPESEESMMPSAPTSVLKSDKPLPTRVLMELARRKHREEERDERIVCRSRSEDQEKGDENDEWTVHGLAIVVFFMIVVALGCLAELVEIVLARSSFFQWKHQPIALPGSDEKALKAFEDWTKFEKDGTSEDEHREMYYRAIL